MNYYNRQMYKYLQPKAEPYQEVSISPDILDNVHCGDSRDMSLIPDNSIHLVITSPPYNVGMEYDEDLDRDMFKSLLKNVLRECYKKLVPGGRVCINVANLGRRPYIVLHEFVMSAMFRSGYYMRGEIIWDKGAAGQSTAWGSWRSASNPTLRDLHEYILVFSKPPFKLEAQGRHSTISRDEFMEYTKSIWHFRPESAKRIGHPAPFPIELPYRLIQLYSFESNIVLDPFVGSGTTCLAAIKTGRHYIGIDNSEEYIALARQRIQEVTDDLETKRLSTVSRRPDTNGQH